MGHSISAAEVCSLLSERKGIGGLSNPREVESFSGVPAGLGLCESILCDLGRTAPTNVLVRSI